LLKFELKDVVDVIRPNAHQNHMAPDEDMSAIAPFWRWRQAPLEVHLHGFDFLLPIRDVG
jgi:hypothetical protein